MEFTTKDLKGSLKIASPPPDNGPCDGNVFNEGQMFVRK